MSSPAVTHPLVDRLLEELQAKDLTQREVAEQLGVAPRTILYWQSGAVPQPRHRRAIRAWLDEREVAA